MDYFPALYRKILDFLTTNPVPARILGALITGGILLFSLIMGLSIFRGCTLNWQV